MAQFFFPTIQELNLFGVIDGMFRDGVSGKAVNEISNRMFA
jgi:hypothetical protein